MSPSFLIKLSRPPHATLMLKQNKIKKKKLQVSVELFIPTLISGDRVIWTETRNTAKAKLQHRELNQFSTCNVAALFLKLIKL